MTSGRPIAAVLAAALVSLALPLMAQADERISHIRPSSDMRWTLNTYNRTAQTILFPEGETIEEVTISVPQAYRSGISGTGDSLVLVPSPQIVRAVMTVETQSSRYEIDLVPATALQAPLVIRIENSPHSTSHTAPEFQVPEDTGQYDISGDRLIRPSAISDDGNKTYLRWSDHQAMPAVFGIGPSGDEEMVEGHMRGGVFTIDRTFGELVFRIDKEKAKAVRRTKGRRR